MGNGFILDLDELYGFLSNMRTGRRHRRYCMPIVEDLIPSHDVHGQITGVDEILAHLDESRRDIREIRARDDGFYPRKGERCRCVNRFDPCMRVWAAQALWRAASQAG